MKKLDRSLGLVSVIAISISAMLGSGIFVLPGLAAAKTGPSVWIAYLLAGLTVLPTALCKSELATAMPASGGSYVYLERIFGPWFGTIAGIAVWASMLLKSAFALLGFGAYLRVFVDLPLGREGDDTLKWFALLMLVVVVALNIIGVKKVGRAQVVVVGTALVGLLALCAYGALSFDARRLTPSLTDGTTGLLAAAGFVFVSYNGVTKVAAIAEEVKNPQRNLPLGILLSLGLVLLLYAAVALVLVGNLDLDVLAHDPKPIHTLAQHLAGPAAGAVAAVLGVVTMTSMANAGLLAASRYPYAMSRDKLLPDVLGSLYDRFRTPAAAIVMTALVMAVTIELLELERVAKLASAVVIVIFMAEDLAVIGFRESRAKWYRPGFRAPFYPALQIFGVLSGLALLVMLGMTAVAALAAVAIPGTALYLLYGRRRTERLGVMGKIGRRGDLLRHDEPQQDAATSEAEAAVVVALFGDERSPEMLVDVGGALAAGRKVHATHLSEVDEHRELDRMLSDDVAVQSLRRRIEALAEEREVDVEFGAVVSRDLVRTVHAASNRAHCDWLVMQWHGRPRRSLTSLSPIGWLINHLPCNLAMFRDVGVRYVRKILVLPAPGPHDALVVRTADDLAHTWRASLTLLRFVPDDASEIEVTAEIDYLSQLRLLCNVPADERVLRGKSRLAAIGAETVGHDLLVMAAPTLTMMNLVLRSIEDKITAEAACSVLTLKTPRGRTHEALSRHDSASQTRRALAGYLEGGAVAAGIDIASKAALFQFMAERFAERLEGVTVKEISDAFHEREREQNTAVGHGVALPHGTLSAAFCSVLGVFVLSEALDYDAPDDEPVQVVFATLCPPSARETHLRLLSDIARLTMKTDVLERLRGAANEEAVIAAIEACQSQLDTRS